MKLTDEQREAVRFDDDVMLTACPGSGKTRVIISKLSRAIDSVRDTPRAVACITYTKGASCNNHFMPIFLKTGSVGAENSVYGALIS